VVAGKKRGGAKQKHGEDASARGRPERKRKLSQKAEEAVRLEGSEQVKPGGRETQASAQASAGKVVGAVEEKGESKAEEGPGAVGARHTRGAVSAAGQRRAASRSEEPAGGAEEVPMWQMCKAGANPEPLRQVPSATLSPPHSFRRCVAIAPPRSAALRRQCGGMTEGGGCRRGWRWKCWTGTRGWR
jgi:hypothetical protein